MAVITISRQYGSGGDEIATRVAHLLGYRYFDKNLLVHLAAEIGLAEDKIVDFSERNYNVMNFLDRLLGQRVFGRAMALESVVDGMRNLETCDLDERRYIAVVQGAVRAAYAQGDTVIVGRGGQAILRDEPGVLHVRLEAPRKARIRAVQEKEGLTWFAEAENKVIERDIASAGYLERFYNLDITDVTLYHLLINVHKWGITAAAKIIVDAVAYLSDSALGEIKAG